MTFSMKARRDADRLPPPDDPPDFLPPPPLSPAENEAPPRSPAENEDPPPPPPWSFSVETAVGSSVLQSDQSRDAGPSGTALVLSPQVSQ